MEYSCIAVNGIRIAEAIATIEVANIRNDVATFYFFDDGWGNSGTG